MRRAEGNSETYEEYPTLYNYKFWSETKPEEKTQRVRDLEKSKMPLDMPPTVSYIKRQSNYDEKYYLTKDQENDRTRRWTYGAEWVKPELSEDGLKRLCILSNAMLVGCYYEDIYYKDGYPKTTQYRYKKDEYY